MARVRAPNPTLSNALRFTALNSQVKRGRHDIIARLLQDPRVRATIDVQGLIFGDTALHRACSFDNGSLTHSLVFLLLQAGANPNVAGSFTTTPLGTIKIHHPSHHATIALLEQAPEAEKASLLVKARRLATTHTSSATVPSYKQNRIVRGEPSPRMMLAPPAEGSQNGDEDEEKERRKLRFLMEFVFGMGGGPKGEGMPRDVFRVVLDLIMPLWDPLRRCAGTGPPAQG